MLQRIWILYTVELQKAVRMKQTFAGPLLLGMLVLCAPLLHSASRHYSTAYDQIANQGYALIAFITPAVLGLPALLLILLFSASLISPELHSGSLRQIFVRPVRRHEYVIAKFLLGCSYALLLLGITALLSWTLAYSLCLLSGSRLSGITFGGELLYSTTQMRNAYLLALLLSLAPCCATAAFGLMISSLTRNTVQAISFAIGAWLIMDAVKYPLHIDRYIFFSYFEKPWQIFVQQSNGTDGFWFPMTWECLSASVIATLLCTAAAILAMERRNVCV